LQILSLRFENVPIVDSIDAELNIILGNDCELIHTRQEIMAAGVAITSIAPCVDSSFLFTTFNVRTRETSIFSTSSA